MHGLKWPIISARIVHALGNNSRTQKSSHTLSVRPCVSSLPSFDTQVGAASSLQCCCCWLLTLYVCCYHRADAQGFTPQQVAANVLWTNQRTGGRNPAGSSVGRIMWVQGELPHKCMHAHSRVSHTIYSYLSHHSNIVVL